jgi:hypothetical protein
MGFRGTETSAVQRTTSVLYHVINAMPSVILVDLDIFPECCLERPSETNTQDVRRRLRFKPGVSRIKAKWFYRWTKLGYFLFWVDVCDKVVLDAFSIHLFLHKGTKKTKVFRVHIYLRWFHFRSFCSEFKYIFCGGESTLKIISLNLILVPVSPVQF